MAEYEFIHLTAVLHHDDTIPVPGKLAAGPDAGGLPGGQGKRLPWISHPDLTDDMQQGRFRFRAAKGILGADTKTIHGGAGKGRKIFGRPDILGQDSAVPLFQGDVLGGQWAETLKQVLKFFGADELEKAFHVIVSPEEECSVFQ